MERAFVLGRPAIPTRQEDLCVDQDQEEEADPKKYYVKIKHCGQSLEPLY